MPPRSKKDLEAAAQQAANSSISNPNSPLIRGASAMDKVLKTDEWRVKLNKDSFAESLPHIPTGSITIDYLLGGNPNKFGVRTCPGLPKGRITQVYGHESCGKTTLALTVSASVCKAGGTVLFIDYENAISVGYAAQLGVPVDDPSRFLLAQPDTLEDGFKIIYAMASAGVDLIVIDSVGAAIPKDVAEITLEEMGKQQRVGLLAQKWSQFLPLMRDRLRKSNTACFAIAQIRDSINTMGHGDSTTVQGGRAWKFYPDLRMKMARIQQETSRIYNAITDQVEEQKASGKIKVTIEKCKVSDAQGKEGIFYIRYGAGIDDLRSFIEIAIAHGVIKKSGGWYVWTRPDGSELKVQGLDKLAGEITKAKAVGELEAAVTSFLSGSKVDIPIEDEDGDGPDDDNLLDGLNM